MAGKLRTTNTIYNFISIIGGQVINVVIKFIIRTIFIRTLGKSYLGIDGLFSNILTMLSLSELGVGSAIIFKLYEPIARKNYHRIVILINWYKNVYRIISIIFLLLGLGLIPLLPYIINDYDKLQFLNINVTLIFILYIFETISSYLFFAYKSAIIKANQKEYIINIVGYISTIICGIIQIVFLIIYPKFEIYVAVVVIQVIGQNIICAKLSDRMYPYINEKIDEKLPLYEIKEIFKDCGALLIYKLNAIVLKATDNIVLSIFLGLDVVALYSNYYIFYSTIQLFFYKVFSSTAHSLGDLHTTNNIKHEYENFEVFIIIAMILGGTAGVGIFCVSDEFIKCWVGSEWIINQPFSLLMGLELLTVAISQMLSQYRTSMGLFQQAKYRPLFGMIINIILSLVWVKKFEIYGVIAATVVSEWVTIMWYDPIIIHKYGFKNQYPIKRYFKKILKYLLFIIFIGFFDKIICQHLLVEKGWFSVVIHTILCLISVPFTLIISVYNNQESKYIIKIINKYINKK